MEADRTGGDEIGRLLGERPAPLRPQGREAGRMVGGKLRHAGEPRLALLRSPLPLGGSGPLRPDARCLPEPRDGRDIESPFEKRYLVELSLQTLPENDRRCPCDRFSLEEWVRATIDMDLNRITTADDRHLVPVIGAETDVGAIGPKGKPEGVGAILPGDEGLRGETGAERPLPVACAAPFAEPHPGNERCIAGRGLAGKHEPSAGQMDRPVDRVGERKRRRHERLTGAAAGSRADAGEIPGEARGEHRRAASGDRISRPGAILVLQPPEADRLVFEHRLGGRPVPIGGRASGLPRHLLERRDERVDDFRFGRDLEAGSPRGPGGVATENMLLGGRDVALSAVGKLDIEVHPGRGAAAELEAGEGVDLVGERRNRHLTDADRLEFERCPLPLVEDDRLAGVNLGDVLGEIIGDPGGDSTGPGKPGLVRQSIAEIENLLRHRKPDIVTVLE